MQRKKRLINQNFPFTSDCIRKPLEQSGLQDSGQLHEGQTMLSENSRASAAATMNEVQIATCVNFSRCHVRSRRKT